MIICGISLHGFEISGKLSLVPLKHLWQSTDGFYCCCLKQEQKKKIIAVIINITANNVAEHREVVGWSKNVQKYIF